MLTIDLERINIEDDQVILDLGCGKGRHIHKLYYYKKCHVIGLDLSYEDLQITHEGFEKYPDIEGDKKRQFNLMAGDAHKLPFPDETFDRVICSEVLEHIPDYENVIKEIFRVAKKDAKIGISVPRWLPEKICWFLSDDYHNEPGGHVHIFTFKNIKKSFTKNGFLYLFRSYKHGLHSPYWWLKCFVGVKNEKNIFVNFYQKFLEWDIMKRPILTKLLEKIFDPLIGKSLVLYFKKNNNG
ncbi:methyltransferase domain-containing protein [Hyphomicrobiales bacterium]|nr:methyltransferase domain-containing protein [Hyphomicrobiales bacterium]